MKVVGDFGWWCGCSLFQSYYSSLGVFVAVVVLCLMHVQTKAMVKRSLFNNGPNIQFTAIMLKVGYERTPELQQWLTKLYSRIGGSQLVEDGVNVGRRSEELAKSTVMSPDRAFATLVNKKVLNQVHKYKEVFFCCFAVVSCVFSFCF